MVILLQINKTTLEKSEKLEKIHISKYVNIFSDKKNSTMIEETFE